MPSCVKVIAPLCPAVQLLGLSSVRLPPRARLKLFESARSVETLTASVSTVTSPRCPAVNVCAVLNTLALSRVEMLVSPVPPSVAARVPVMEEAARSTASSLLSMTAPPLAFRSRANVVVVPLTDVSTPSPPVLVSVPLAVIAVPEPVSAAGVMLVTVPEPPPPETVAQVLSPRRYVVELAVPVAESIAMSTASAAIVVALPTLVTSPVRFALVVTVPAVRLAAVPVRFVATPLAGVPSAGVTSVGLVAKTKAPLPVSSEITPANCAEVVAARTDRLLVV